MAHLKERLSRPDFQTITGDTIRFVADFCKDKNLSPSVVITILLACAGEFGYSLVKTNGDNPNLLLDEIRQFLQTTRSLFPDFTFDGDPYLGHYQQVMQYAALQEKASATVH